MSAKSRDEQEQLPLRILQVLEPPDGGVPEHVFRLTCALLERGHEVTVAGPANARSRPFLEEAGARYVPLPIVGSLLSPRRDVRTLATLLKLLRSQRYDVVHTHAQKAGVLGRIAALRAGVPALYTPHSFVYRTQRLRPRPSAKVRFRLSLALERALGHRAAAIIGVSEDERRAAAEDRLAPPNRVHVVYYGVSVDRTLPADPELARFRGDGPLFGFVAGLRDQKGLPTLLEALELLAARCAAPRFAIVGNGPLRDEVAARIAASPLRATTLLAPFGGRVEPYLRALDVFVLPSYWEGLPIAILEAMGMGLPVIASSVNGTPEAVADGETGQLVPPSDALALAAAIERLAADGDARERYGAAGRIVVERNFRPDRMLDELESLYRAVATSSSQKTDRARSSTDAA